VDYITDYFLSRPKSIGTKMAMTVEARNILLDPACRMVKAGLAVD
jgi:hypothetical protein